MSRYMNAVWTVMALTMITSAVQAQTTNIFPLSGNVGVGTTTPGYPFTVVNSGTAGINFASFLQANMSVGQFNSIAVGHDMSGYDCGALQFTYVGAGSNQNFTSLGNCAANQILNVLANGNVGIGTTNPVGALQVVTPSDTNNGNIPTSSFTSMDSVLAGASGSAGGVYASYNQSNNTGFIGAISPGVAWRNLVFNALGGKVGIGTTSPVYSLDVTGTIRATQGIVFPDGTSQVTAFAPTLCSSTGADYAESVGITGDRTEYEPGDILVIDPTTPGKFLQSSQAYSTLVSGIYSTKPGFVGRLHAANDPSSADEVPMAMVGRVPTKVSAENGPIRVGDLLVSSSTPGRAMKGTDRTQMLGAVIGKALGSLDSGFGVIEVLVTLQ